MEKELHLIVLWHNARYKEKEILEDIAKNVKILECVDIKWNKQNVANNFTRFYGVKLDSGSSKEKECGTGNFLLVIVLDENPKYDFVETSRGHEYVNINIFSLKEKYRSWTKGGHKIHTTNTPKETNHDITLLLGINYDDYIKQAPNEWNGKIEYLEKDLVGCNGCWNSLNELFYTLNSTINYVVLRGMENIAVTLKNFDDIDIFTDEYTNACFIVNGIPKINVIRPHYLVNIGEKSVYIDIWDKDKQYYDTKWADNVLNTKITSNGYYVPNYENSFFETIYHCLFHKDEIKNKHLEKLSKLYNILYSNTNPNNMNYYYELLIQFMESNNYSFTVPQDKSVFFHDILLKMDEQIKWLEKNYFIKNIKPYKLDKISQTSLYYTGWLNDNKVFIKTGNLGERTCSNEYKMLKNLHDKNPDNFLKPYFYKNDGKINNIVIEFVEGENLESIIKNQNLTEKEKDLIVYELENIAKTLKETHLVHRDIIPSNFILANDGHIKLLDTAFTVSAKKYKEDRYIKKHYNLIRSLGGEFAFGQYVWDDFYSLSKILNLIGRKSEYIDNSIGQMRIKLKKYKQYKPFWTFFLSFNIDSTKAVKKAVITFFGIKLKINIGNLI